MARVLVTTGLSRWPFDRLVGAADALSGDHEVFIQVGASTVRPRCAHAAGLSPADLQARIGWADVVLTHAGNTVRELQRAGVVPVVVAREPERGEAADDHQVQYLEREEVDGRVIAVWDVADLGAAVDEHRTRAAAVADRPVPPAADPADVARRLDDALDRRELHGPFAGHHLRRYHYAWTRLAARPGLHLDVGVNDGLLLHALTTEGGRRGVGVDVMADYLAEAAARRPRLDLVRVHRSGALPFPDATFSTASLLDVLEHVPDPDLVLEEIRRVLEPGGEVVVTVPARHALSFLDPDDAKLRFPRVHGAVYRARFGADRYRERFVDLSDGYRGDLAVERESHTNYDAGDLFEQLRAHGLEPVERAGANLLWQLANPVRLLGGRRGRRLADRAIRWDGERFDRANLFVTAVAGVVP